MDRWQRLEPWAILALMLLCVAAILALPNIFMR